MYLPVARFDRIHNRKQKTYPFPQRFDFVPNLGQHIPYSSLAFPLEALASLLQPLSRKTPRQQMMMGSMRHHLEEVEVAEAEA